MIIVYYRTASNKCFASVANLFAAKKAGTFLGKHARTLLPVGDSREEHTRKASHDLLFCGFTTHTDLMGDLLVSAHLPDMDIVLGCTGLMHRLGGRSGFRIWHMGWRCLFADW